MLNAGFQWLLFLPESFSILNCILFIGWYLLILRHCIGEFVAVNV